MNYRIDIKRAVSDHRMVEFVYAFDGDLWYKTDYGELFAVPLTDIKGATFYVKDKGIVFMRWMRKHNELVDKTWSKPECA
jgi:hypothetical protein